MPIYLEHKPILLYHFNNINDGVMAGGGILKLQDDLVRVQVHAQ